MKESHTELHYIYWIFNLYWIVRLPGFLIRIILMHMRQKNHRSLLWFPGMTEKQITSMHRLPFTKLSEKAHDRFRVSENDRKKAYDMEMKSWGGISKTERKTFLKKLRGVERILGFKLPWRSYKRRRYFCWLASNAFFKWPASAGPLPDLKNGK